MKILVTGSIAYDTIMVFPDRFRNHLLADQLHILNVCFLAPEMRREYGGTAGNIGYNLRLLGESPLIMATVGEDIQPYLDRFDALGIATSDLIAYDTIMVFPDRFRNHLLADQLHILNVCFLAPEMRREYGGTAGNIGYNLRLLGESPLIMATVGEDIQPYLDRFDALGIAT